MSTGNTEARVVICGSMKNVDLMTKIAELLEDAGLRVVTPIPDEPGAWSVEASQEMKREASRRHMMHIRNRATAAILVVNVDRPDANNYVGPNSFAEIGVAFSDDRPVFLLQGMPECYAEELVAWGVECLNGDLARLVEALGGRQVDWSR
jgi:hypothetical protein